MRTSARAVKTPGKGRGCFWALAAIVAVALLLWLGFKATGLFFTVQKDGGWTNQSAEIDFSIRTAADRVLVNRENEEGPQSLILLIADGMGMNQVAAARMQLGGVNRPLFFERFPVAAWVRTHSVESIYSDSAANGTAIATGFKTKPGRLGVDGEGRPLRSLLQAAQDTGKATGLLTDSYFFDATPAAFAVHSEDRRDYPDVIRQFLNSGVDLFGGEVRDDYPEGEAGFTALQAEVQAAGYRLVDDAGSIARASAGKLAAIYQPDTIANPERAPQIVDLLTSALERLSGDEHGFLLMAETEDPDSGAHNHDLDQLVRGVASLEKMAAAAQAFAERDGSTLVVVTADHETGGLTLIGGGPDEKMGVRWSSTSHTAGPVPVYAYGPGAERLFAVRDNTEIAPILADLLGLDL